MRNILLSVLLVLISQGFRVTAQMQSKTWDFIFPYHQDGRPALDLRFLNEAYAGEHGFIRLSADGNSFVRGDGVPIRFWPVNEMAMELPDSSLEKHARFLAQMGVNMCRYHLAINAKGKGTSLYDFDMEVIRNLWRFIAAMKKEGIYATLSPFWPHNGHMGGWVPEEWGIDGYSGKDDLWGQFYFNDTLRTGYKNWMRALYTLTNPYTGIALRDDPALALIQIMNEDGVFFWTMQFIKPELQALVVKKFVKWLENYYGSLENALKTWGSATLPEDDILKKAVGLYPTWEMTQAQDGQKALRVRDQVRFYAEIQYKVYKEIYDFYKNDLGCRQLINTMNWTTASPSRLHDLERWTNTAAEVMASNRYYDPGHSGENNGWRIDPGHYYIGASALQNPTRLPLNIKQVKGHPFLITESGWNTPHKYMAEGPFLVSVYQSLTGMDGFYWFCITDENYSPFPYFEHVPLADGQYPMNRWTCSVPGMLAQFPANALVYRQGYLKQGETVVNEKKNMKSLFNREESALYEDRNFDPNRDQFYTGGPINKNTEISPLAFLTGPVMVEYTDSLSSLEVNSKLSSLANQKAGTVKGISGEQELDYMNGICRVNSPKAQGVCGFLSGKGKFALEDVSITSSNAYAAIWVVSMDGMPLDSSRKILVQCGTTYTPTGWKEEAADFSWDNNNYKGYRIINTGRMPWQANITQASIEINNPAIRKATLLDVAGYAYKEIPVKRTGHKIFIEMPEDALYLILE